ncbi:iron-containing alcohol dehydrogenase [Hominifimenecus sp. rT4P-3]|uniref:iron-containing alcohol dehydrogenase n=1 Tax=Hominifimenecus sp. rT4P-3 TaxID=3242979 RepID=UPI003DA3F224
MESFTYYTPTKVFFGEDAESHIGKALKEYGVKKVLLHYGGGSIKRIGLYDKVVSQLTKAEIPFVELGGVEPNPKIGLIRKGVELCRAEQVDFLLGVGGGSVCDSCKAIGMGLTTGLDPWEVVSKNIVPEKPFPMGLVLTIAAAGSEMSNSCVITNEETNLKRGCNHDANRPTFAFLNPVNTLSVSKFQTAAGIVDIMMHTMERYLTSDPETPLTDRIAESLLKLVKEYGTRLMQDPQDLEARAQIMWASTLGHNDITGCGRNKTFTAHKIEHDLSGVHDGITHGAGLAVVFPAWVRYEYKNGIDRFYQWAVNIWDAEPSEDKEKAILEGVDHMVAFFRSLDMPVTMKELGVTPEEYEKISKMTTNGDAKPLPSFGKPLTSADIREIYRLAE